ncbi:head GIN domain-containing protein [Flavobacterium sp.]|uniref:head GIN domain-containing protein n=1 Tax=Flavobacterium sp. TaxID=239 RepID=UPI00286E46EB|nr:head GIN domain-containing protein [Flavobacterium sp.]
MKNSIQLSIVLLLFASTITNAQSWGNWEKIKGNGNQKNERRTTAEYDEIKLQGYYDVDLIAGKEGEITVQAEENLMPYIKIEVEGNVLKIYQEKGKNLQPSKGNKILITVPFDKISAVSLSGSGDVNTKNLIKTDKFTATLSGSGDLNLDIEANDVEAKLSGSGDVRLKGKSDKLTVSISGSGDITASNLIVNDVEAGISGSGDIKVNCSGNLNARVSGSGDIFYSGEPKNKDTKVSGSGNIKKG